MMGLFSKKKKEDSNKPDLPKFPEFPKFNHNQEENEPSYQPEFKHDDIKELPKEVPHDSELNIPIRKPGIPKKRPEPEQHEEFPFNPINEPFSPIPPMSSGPIRGPPQMGPDSGFIERPLFIKVEDYREAMGNIEALKRTLKETEELLEKLDSIRMAEEEELKRAHSNVDAIKEQLLFIDKRLFEV